MNGVGSILELETETNKESPLHAIDGRVKLVLLIFIIVYSVFSTQILVLILLEIYLLILMYISTISVKTSIKRVLLLLPFGGFIIAFQPFIHPGIVIWSGAFGIHITDLGLLWATLLMSRLVVALTSIVILSSISPMQEVVESFRKLGMPREFALIFSLMIRFLFMFFDELNKIMQAQKTRCFDAFNKKLPYTWRMKQLGYTVAMMFLRAFERGETIYMSMASRGYSDKSHLYSDKKRKFGSGEYIFIITTLSTVVCLQFLAMFVFTQFGILGMYIIK